MQSSIQVRSLSATILASALALSGCSSMLPNRISQPLDVKENALASVKRPWVDIGGGFGPVDYVPITSQEDLVVKEMDDSDALPEFQVGNVSYSNAALYDVIRTLVDYSPQPISLSININGAQGTQVKKFVSAFNVKGRFPEVFANLSSTAGFYYRYKNNVLTVSSDRQFIAALPPVSELFESIPNVLASLGATEVLLDRSARVVTFRANKIAQNKIDGYLSYIRKNRSLITYDCYIWEVALNDRSRMGISWRDFPAASAADTVSRGIAATYQGGASSAAVNLTDAASLPGGAGIGLAIQGSRFALNVLIDFLQTQGTLNNISQPKISMLSGSTAQFRNGTSIPYVSRISPGVLSNGVWVAGSADTSTLQTGLTLTISGDVSDGTVFSDVSLRMADLIRMDQQQVAVNQGTSTTISLPVSADREVNARLRARPGDAIIVGGINLEQVSNDFSKAGPVPLSSDKNAQRSELVVVLIPRVTHFVHSTAKGTETETKGM